MRSPLAAAGPVCCRGNAQLKLMIKGLFGTRRRRLRAIVMRMPHNLALIGDSTRGLAMLALRGGQLRCRMSSNYSERGAMQQQCLLLATPDVCERRHVA